MQRFRCTEQFSQCAPNGAHFLFCSSIVKSFAGAHENYTLKDIGGKTELIVDMDMNDQYKDYFTQTFPKALAKVKELAELA
jgi:hypothetical protein